MDAELAERVARFKVPAKIGLLITGHHYYWTQFPGLKERGMRMSERLVRMLTEHAEVVATELVDSESKSRRAAELFRRKNVDLLAIFPLGYTPSMHVIPMAGGPEVPIRILNAHEDRSYDYSKADVATYLHHEGVCCVPEFAGALGLMKKKFKVRTGHFEDPRFIEELKRDISGAAAAHRFRSMNVGLIGQVYTNMTDMPVDEQRLLKSTCRMLMRPEIEEIENAFLAVSEDELHDMYRQLRELFEVDESVTNDHLETSAKIAVAYEKVIRRHDIDAFGYYWWGQKELITQLRAQSNLAVSRLAALGRPGVTEGDVKSAMAMKLLAMLGAGGIFFEFFSMDFDEDFMLMGHDGPNNIAMAAGRPRLRHLDVHHGKSGHGLGIDFKLAEGPVTIVNLARDEGGDTFKLIYTVADIISGEVLRIGNPNTRVRFRKPLHEFMDSWCQQGPSHHVALGYGDQGIALETFAEAMGFRAVRI